MKLDPDCIRAILITVEENSGFRKATCILPGSDNFPLLSSYTYDEVAYHVRQCEWSNLIYDAHYYPGSTIDIEDLTPAGHEFLANIRENKIWTEVKSIATHVGSESLSALTQIAATVVARLVKTHFGINF